VYIKIPLKNTFELRYFPLYNIKAGKSLLVFFYALKRALSLFSFYERERKRERPPFPLGAAAISNGCLMMERQRWNSVLEYSRVYKI